MTKFRACSMGLVLYALGTSVVHAMLMDFEFDVTFDSGPLSGNTYTGEFTLGGYTGAGVEEFDQLGSADPTRTVDAFAIEIEGSRFDLQNTFGPYPSAHPIILFSDGVLQDMSYSGCIPCTFPHSAILDVSFSSPNNINYTDYYGGPCDIDDAECQGMITRVAPAIIPEASTLSLFGIGLAGLGFARRRMKV